MIASDPSTELRVSGSTRYGGITASRSAISAWSALNLSLLVLLALGAAAQSQKQKGEQFQGEPATTKLRIEVVAGEKDEPVENASVYVKFVQERKLARDKKIEMDVKTNRNGIAGVPSVPRGKVLVQVVAPGWKTFGQWYDLDKPEQTIKIKLQKPPRWY